MSVRCRAVLLLAGLLFAAAPASFACADELVMFETRSCPWCRAWHAEVGTVYDKTSEGQRLPLRRVDLDLPRPGDLAAIGGVRFTPTFVVLHCGREAGRILGYAGEEQFWALLGEVIESIGRDVAPC